MARVPRYPSLPIVSITAALLALAASSLQAQARGSMSGMVLDEASGAPIQGAAVTILDQDVRAETDDEGRFLLPDIPSGEVALRVEAGGYSSVVEQVEVSSVDVAFLRVELPRMEAMLDRLLVQSDRRSAGRGHSEAEVRRRESSESAVDLLASEVPGVNVSRAAGIVGSGASIRIRGVSTITGTNDPAIFLDGIRIDGGGSPLQGGGAAVALHALDLIPADEVDRIRVLRGPSAASQYADAANGVILIETRRGDEDDEGGDDEDEG